MSSLLFRAVEKRDLASVEDLISSGTNVNQIRSTDGATPLFLASRLGYKDIVSRLIGAGADINKATTRGSTPLFTAAQNGHINVVGALIAAGADVNKAMSDNTTPLYIAAQNGHRDIVSALIAAGANVNKYTSDGESPVLIAAYVGNTDIVNVLIAAGADLNKAKENGATALFFASEKGHKEIVNALIAAGANINQAKNDDNATPLFIAAQNGHKEIVTSLIVAGADVDKARSDNTTPLFIAVQNGHKEIVTSLIAAGADVNKTTNWNASPLIKASVNGYIEIVNVLIAAGADVNTVLNRNNETALFFASENGHKEIVDALIASGADVNKANGDNATPLFMAAQNGHKEIVKRLLQVSGIDTKLVLEKIYLFSDDIKSIFEDLMPKWKPVTQSSVSLFDAIFDIDYPTDPVTGLPTGKKPVAINTSTCPICFSYTVRSEACNYMKHNCTAHGNYFHKKLYDKYKNPEGQISWCTICGRICVGHRHYKLSDPDGPKPELTEPPIGGENVFADDCRRGGGGGLEEKFKRFRRAREVFRELDSTLRYDEAMDILIEEMWRAPLSRMPLKPKINAMMAAKKFTNYPTETFPPNEVATAAAAIVKVIDPIASSRLPELVTLASPVMNAFSYNDLPTILHFKHGSMSANRPDAHKDETDVSKDVDRIGIASFFDQLKARIEKGEIGLCWKHPECQTPLHPDEVDEAVRMAVAEGGMNAKAVETFQEIARRYRGQYTMKFGRVVAAGATGGGTAQPAGGAGLGRRTRRTRRRSHK